MAKEEKDTPQAQPRWEREEQILLVVEYFLNKEDRLYEARSDVFLSEFLKMRAKKLGYEVGEKYRNLWGIQSQRENLRHFDPDSKSKVTGHESIWMEKVVREYLNDPQGCMIEAYEIIKKYISI